MPLPNDPTHKPDWVDHGTHTVIAPVRDLAERAMTGGGARDVDAMLAKAEQNLASLKKDFPEWMATEFASLEEAWDNFKGKAPSSKALLFRKVHDMRGQAATLGYPLAGRAADSLCKLMDTLAVVPDSVIEAHIQTIRVIIRENVNVEDHPVGVMMIKALDKLSYDLIQQALKARA
ncbi:MAG: hypothetical protein NT037_09130 [Hyphomicrobiales bacterium]|jgi:hypothetical protein|nr:hypothetical protein [Hyphomicrobiales bacterium]